MVSLGIMNRPVMDQLDVKRPSLCSTEGPSLRPDLPTPGHCSERRSRMARRATVLHGAQRP